MATTEVDMPDGTKIDFKEIDPDTTLIPDDFFGFGFRDSNVYREMLFSHFQDSKLDPTEKFVVFVLCVAIKNKSRIIKSLEANKTKWSKKNWYKKVLDFFKNRTVQYTTESDSKVPVVNIPNSCPTITALAWIVVTPPASRTKDNFLKNLWAIQFKGLTQQEVDDQKAWEKNFWDNTVKKTRNTNTKGYDAAKGFQEDFWNTKAADEYILATIKGDEMFDMTQWDDWLLKSAPDVSTV
jgi:hypothetical protein